MTVTYRYLGYGTTDSNGVALLDHDANGDTISHSYTGTGAGKIDVVASTDHPISSGSLQSERYDILDCLYYDKALDGTGNHNDLWYSSGVTLTRTSTGTTVVGNNTDNSMLLLYYGNANNCIPSTSDFCIEFDLISENNCGMFMGDSSNYYAYTLNIPTGSSFVHHKIVYSASDNTLTQYQDGVARTPISTSVTGNFGFRLVDYQKDMDIIFKNFEVYPI